jgi:hypothetical protein
MTVYSPTLSKIFFPPSFPRRDSDNSPQSLYHYTSYDGLLGILDTGGLWATKIHYMNDSTEFNIAVELVQARLREEYRFTEPVFHDQLTNLSDHEKRVVLLSRALERIRNVNVCAVCFCANGDLLSQWRGYSTGFGVSIGFDSQKLKPLAEAAGFVFGKCIYTPEVQNKIMSEICEYYLDPPRSLSMEEQFGGFARSVIACGAFFKDSSFSAENEWRLVSKPVDVSDFKFRTGKSLILPYYTIEFPPSKLDTPIVHVIVGPCPHLDLAVSAVELLLLREEIAVWNVGLPSARAWVYRSEIPYRDW